MRQCLHVGWMSFALLCPGEAAEPVFEKDIQPVLQRKCGQCHTGGKRKGGLSLATMAGLRRGGESEEAIVGKVLDDSLLWKMISKGEMPPKGKARLTEAETGLIQRWIETGAKSTAPVEVAEKKINQHDVLPIVLLRCTACHGA
ncbi:MAG: c-type cytochrome domain-containing protein, partial [Verrucomicrobiota bacterium]|nr:c-type cytochrome domain-containing protein [Verrucomicrobiota bacterium]